jgi:hypothetical protein
MNRFFSGLDLGQTTDSTAMAVLEQKDPDLFRHVEPDSFDPLHGRSITVTAKQDWGGLRLEPSDADKPRAPKKYKYLLRHLDRYPLGTSYPQIVENVTLMYEQPPLHGSVLAVDMTGVGRPVVDMFLDAASKGIVPPEAWIENRKKANMELVGQGRMRLTDHERWCRNLYSFRLKLKAKVRPILITGGNRPKQDGLVWSVPKKDLAGIVQVLVGSRPTRLKYWSKLKLLPLLLKELQNFQIRLKKETGNEEFGHRTGQHDDIVLALQMACWMAEKGMREFWLRV